MRRRPTVRRRAPDSPTASPASSEVHVGAFARRSRSNARRIGPIRFSAVILPNAANSTASSGTPSAARTRARAAASSADSNGAMPRWIASIGTSGNSSRRSAATRALWTATQPRRAHHDAQHRPEVVDRPAQSLDRVLDEVAARVAGGRTRTRAGSRRTAPAGAGRARAPGGAAHRAGRRGPGRRAR